MSRNLSDDVGVAAVEMAIISTVLLLLAFGALPLFSMGHAYQSTNSASADTLRYATGVDANAHSTTTSSGTVIISRRPTANDVTRFAQAAANDSTLVVVVKVCPDGVMTACAAPVDPSRPLTAASGDTVTVTVSKVVDLSLFGSVANAAGTLVGGGDIYPNGTVTITSTSTGREE
jgi:Flp pilus assembly protein TadG